MRPPKCVLRNRTFNAFTLIELLATIGIIALLAALIFPVFARAREKGRQTTCLSRFRQISQGIHLYIQDYDETMPMAQTGQFASTDWKVSSVWPQLLLPYHRDWRLFACPNDPNANDAMYRLSLGVPPNADIRQLEFARAYFSDFGYNYMFLAPPPDSEGKQEPPANLSAIRAPSSTILGADSSYNRETGPGICFLYPPSVYNYWQGEQVDGASPYGYVWPRHLRRANVAFTDGHCKALTIDTLMQGVDLKTGVITDPALFLWDLN
jgi:prepilin-type N-terminal cleavage/methylation domain-containing protein/prepilin-type processing-associated H-X9-DG protein